MSGVLAGCCSGGGVGVLDGDGTGHETVVVFEFGGFGASGNFDGGFAAIFVVGDADELEFTGADAALFEAFELAGLFVEDALGSYVG